MKPIKEFLKSRHRIVLCMCALAFALSVYNFFSFYELYRQDTAWVNFLGDQLYYMQYSTLPGASLNAYRIDHGPEYDLTGMAAQIVMAAGIVTLLFRRWIGFFIYALAALTMVAAPFVFIRVDLILRWENAILFAGIPLLFSLYFGLARKQIRGKHPVYAVKNT